MRVMAWSYPRQEFVETFMCDGEKRARIDVHDGLENYALFEVTEPDDNGIFNLVSDQPLQDWVLDLT